MDVKQIKELIHLMEKHHLRKLSVREKNGTEIQLERGFDPHGPEAKSLKKYDVPHNHLASEVIHAQNPVEPPKSATEPNADSDQPAITSPLVGTFYASPSPDDPSFVKVGDRVSPDTVVCIVEAMKVMNEVKAGMSGVITAIVADNGEPVEFGSRLFLVKQD